MAHMFTDGTWGVRVQGVYKARKLNPTDLDKNVGDGRYGYRTRPKKDGVTETQAWDGQTYIRSSRKTVAGKIKAGSRLASKFECQPVNTALVAERRADLEARRADQPRFRARKGQRPVR